MSPSGEQDLSSGPRPTASRLGDWIRTARTARGISQRLLAERSALSRSYVSEIESGHGSHPSLATLDKLAAALGTSRTELMHAAGYIDDGGGGASSNLTELQLLTLFRDLSPGARATAVRFIRFVHAEEHRWIQPLLDLPAGGADAAGTTGGPSLFDAIPLHPAERADSP